MPSIVQVGFTALTVASTALAHFHHGLAHVHARQYFNTSAIHLSTGTAYVPTGYVPTGYVPTGVVPSAGIPTGGIPTGPVISAPYGNTTTTRTAPHVPPTIPVTVKPTPTDVVTTKPGATTKPEGTTKPVITTKPELTTSTIYATLVETVTSCPPVVTKCPLGSVVTRTVAISTTICPVSGHPEPTEPAHPTYVVIPVPPKDIGATTVITQILTSTSPSGEEHPVTSVTTKVVPPGGSAPNTSPVAPYPTGGHGGSSAHGTGTGVVYPTAGTPYVPGGVLTTKVLTPPKPEATGPPPLSQSAAGKVGVSSVLGLVLASVFALMY